MKHTQEEILEALQIIKDECIETQEKLEGCGSCPFYVNHECFIACKDADKWELNTGGPVWKAFK